MSNVQLPLTSPQFLTEQMFINYGFFTGSASSFMIQAAFCIAENQISREIGTFVYPTTFTGTYGFLGFDIPYESPVGKLISVDSIVLHKRYYNGLDQYISGTSYVRDFDNGYYFISQSPNDNSACIGCVAPIIGFYQYNASITAGYQSGTISNQPTLQLAACMAADIALKMMYDEGIGVQYENLVRTLQIGRLIQTMETKYFLNTVFGPSSRGNYISKLLEPYKITRTGFLGRM
jgi:hypothetical protein